MKHEHIRRPPLMLPGLGSPLETEIRRIEFSEERGVRSGKAESIV